MTISESSFDLISARGRILLPKKQQAVQQRHLTVAGKGRRPF